jgi:hypothetical protein
MPQDGWTETVAASRIDLTATVAHVCELALLPAATARPRAAWGNPLVPGELQMAIDEVTGKMGLEVPPRSSSAPWRTSWRSGTRPTAT